MFVSSRSLQQLQLNTSISLLRRSWKSGINVCWCLGMQKWMNMEGYLIRMMAVTFILIRMLKIMKSMYDDAPFLTWHPLPPSLVNMMIAYYYNNTCLPDQISYMFLTWQGLWSTGQPWSCSPMVPLFFFVKTDCVFQNSIIISIILNNLLCNSA